MKKAILLLCTLGYLSICFAQTDWGPWVQQACYLGLSSSSRGLGYVKTIDAYSFQVKIKSSYSKKVVFNMSWTVGSETLSIGQVTLNPGETYQHIGRYFKTNGDGVTVSIDKVNFSGKLNCYAQCDNGTPNQPDCENTSTSAGSASSNQSMSDLAAKNAEIQRKNQENAEKNAQYQHYYNAGVKAFAISNWSEAASQFEQAMGYATNDQQKNNAQENYNKAIKNNVQIQTTKIVTNTLLDAAKRLDEAIAANKRRKEAAKNSIALENKLRMSDLEYAEAWYSDLYDKFSKYSTFDNARSKELKTQLDNEYKSQIAKFGGSTTFLSYTLFFADFDIIFSLMNVGNFRQTVFIRCFNSDVYEQIIKESPIQKFTAGKADVTKDADKKTIDIKNISYEPEFEMAFVFSDVAPKNPNEGVMIDPALTIEELLTKAKDLRSQTDPTALAYYEALAKKGNTEGMRRAGGYYAGLVVNKNGQPLLPKNYDKAIFWYQTAIDSGDYGANIFLGLLYEEGKGVVMDYNKAKDLYTKAADKGEAYAMYRIGFLYKYGGHGIQQDQGKVKEFYTKACEGGYTRGCDEVKKL